MEFAQPEHLAYLLLLPLLYLFSLPPRPKRTQATAHLTQWLAARQRLVRQPVRFRWLRFLLLALAFLGVVMAHTGPRLRGTKGATDLVILVDTSASMAARANAEAAFVRARAVVDEILAATPAHVDVRLGLCSDTLTVLRGDREGLQRRLAAVAPRGPGTLDLEATARELGTATTAVLTITDGLGSSPAPVSGGLRVVGQAAPNIGIVGCTVEDAWPLPEIVIRLRVANQSADAAQCRVRCEGALTQPITRAFELLAGRSVDVECRGRRGPGGGLVVRLESDRPDALAADDVVTIGIPEPARPEIVVRAEGEPGVALLAVAEALAAECGGRVVVGEAPARAGFLIVEGGVLTAPPRDGVRMLSFGTAFGAVPRRYTPRILDWDRTHRVTAGLDFSELLVEAALDWPQLPANPAVPGSREADEVLLRAERRTLAMLHGSAAWASVHVAFRLQDSNLFKLAAFPQFVRRCFAASYGRKIEPRIEPGALLDPAETNLQRPGARPAPRGLPAFATEPVGLAVPCLLLGLLLLAIRVYV